MDGLLGEKKLQKPLEPPLKFLFVANTPRDSLAGASGADIALIEALRELGHHVDEVWASDMTRRIAHPNLHQLLELPRNFARAVARKCEMSAYDVVQVNQAHAWLAARRHRQANRPGIFVNRSHGWEPASKRAISEFGSRTFDSRSPARKLGSWVISGPLERHNELALRWSDGVIAASDLDKAFILGHSRIDGERIHALKPGVCEKFLSAPVQHTNSREDGLLYIGNYTAPKAPEIVTEVFRHVARRAPDSRLTWVVSEESHAQIARQLGPEAGRVRLLGQMDRVQLMQQFDTHGLFMLPSHFEGFGLVFLEAMARGMCVIGTRVGGMPHCIADGKNGYLVPAGNAQVIADRVVAILNDPEKMRSVGNEGRRVAMQFTWARSAAEYVGFCQRIAAGKQGNRDDR